MPRILEVTSAKNPIVQRVRDAAGGASEDELVVEGVRVVEDLLATELAIRAAVFSPKLVRHKGGWDLRRRLEQRADQCFECPDSLLERISALTTHQGVLAIAMRPRHAAEALLQPAPALVVVAAGVRDPGNLGAMLRAAEASGATGFVAMRDGADPYRDKAVRGSAGSALRVPMLTGVDEAGLIEFARGGALRLVVADHDASAEYLEADLRGPVAIVLGNEGAGAPRALVDAADQRVRIPMRPPVESLNVAVATGVLLFEARRQRR